VSDGSILLGYLSIAPIHTILRVPTAWTAPQPSSSCEKLA